MFKFLVFCVLLTVIYSENIDWFRGRWLPIVLYSNTFTNKTEQWVGWHGEGYIGLWTGWLLEPKECGWLEVNRTSQNCTCGNRTDIPLVKLNDLANLNTHTFYDFHMNESRPIIIVDRVDQVKTALSKKCKCGDKEATQLVFRKTSAGHLMSYENKERTETGPNMTLVMLRFVPTMTDLQHISRHYPTHYLDTPYSELQEPTLMCDPSFFDDSAYVMDSAEDNSPLITFRDIKNDKL